LKLLQLSLHPWGVKRFGIVIGVARSEECSEFDSLADNFLVFDHRQKSQEFLPSLRD